MEDRSETLYNRALDVTTITHISVKLFAMFVVIKYTPEDHRCHSYFILNIMFWNFLSNMIVTFVHVIPLLPAECMRLNGLLSILISSEAFGHAVFLTELTATCHCTLALALAIVYRYIVFAYPDFIAESKPYKVVILCFGLHAVTFLLIPLSLQWTVSYDDYPEKDELPARTSVFCFYPHGLQKFLGIITYSAFIFACVIAGTVFSLSIMVKLRRERAFHSQTTALQRKLFFSLGIITAITFLFGGLPLIIIFIAGCFPHLPYARYMTMVTIVVICNHGTIYSVAYLILFKAYRNAIKKMIFKFTKRWIIKIFSVQSNVIVA